jgi:predicted transcriptional regulator
MMGAIEPLSNLALDQAAAELDLEPGWITWLWAFCLFGSDPFSTAAYMRIRPYGSARVNEDRFTSAVRQGILTANSQNEYLLTEKGKHFANKFLQAADASIAHLQPIPIAELQKIADYGKRLVEASLAAPEPPSRFAITRYYRNIHPGQEAQLLRLVLHYVATLDQYRGAAHLASWQHHNLEGCAWSVLTSIWRGEANTLDALHEEVGQPVFSREEILQALRDLVNRGWIEERTDKYQMTPEGQRIRQEAEELTDRHFFPPWACLNETEQEDLLSLATQLSAGLKNSMGK